MDRTLPSHSFPDFFPEAILYPTLAIVPKNFDSSIPSPKSKFLHKELENYGAVHSGLVYMRNVLPLTLRCSLQIIIDWVTCLQRYE